MDLHLAFRSNRTLKTGPSFIKSNPISLLIGVTRRKNKEKAERERERDRERKERERRVRSGLCPFLLRSNLVVRFSVIR